MCNYANTKLLTWPHQTKKMLPQAGNSHVRTQLKSGFLIFFYRNVALDYLSQDFGLNT